MGKFTQHMGKFTQSLHVLCNDDRVNIKDLHNISVNLHILCNNCKNIKMQQQITRMHRYHAQIVIKTRTMNFFQVKLLPSLRCFLKNLHH